MAYVDGKPSVPTETTATAHVDVPLSGERILRVSRLPDVVVLRVGKEVRRQESVTLIPGPSIVLPATATPELRKALGRVADVR